MVKYKVSVILPVYNGEKTLATTLESLVNQTFKDFELVCCIDGTNDESENIINLFRDKFNKLTILKNQLNRGLGATMNRLMSNTNGEYIAIAEQDDYYYKDYYNCLLTENLKKFDTPSVFFFMGILTAVAALQSAGHLVELATFLNVPFDRLIDEPEMRQSRVVVS